MTSVLRFRRDLRLHDHPAMLEAAGDGPVAALFVLDSELLRRAAERQRALARCRAARS